LMALVMRANRPAGSVLDPAGRVDGQYGLFVTTAIRLDDDEGPWAHPSPAC
jgi:hypothetical protein